MEKHIFKVKVLNFFRKYRRENRNLCWCGGDIDKKKINKNYGVCCQCGSHVNFFPIIDKDLEKFYSFQNYWHLRQEKLGHPTIKKRSENDLLDGRVDYWLELIKKYSKLPCVVIEIGCAHGVLIKKLLENGCECYGVEVDEKTASWTEEKVGIKIFSGLFPNVNIPQSDLILCFDVFEHSNYPEFFLKKIYSSLTDGGVAIIQSPLMLEELEDIYKNDKLDYFSLIHNELEHQFIFSSKAIRLLVEKNNFKILYFGRGKDLMHEILVLKK